MMAGVAVAPLTFDERSALIGAKIYDRIRPLELDAMLCKRAAPRPATA